MLTVPRILLSLALVSLLILSGCGTDAYSITLSAVEAKSGDTLLKRQVSGHLTSSKAGLCTFSSNKRKASILLNTRLRSGDVITLRYNEASAADLDLFLIDSTGSIIEASMSPASSEVLTVPANSAEMLRVGVCAVRGKSTYTVSVASEDQAEQLSAPHSFVLSLPIVSGQALVQKATDDLITSSTEYPSLFDDGAVQLIDISKSQDSDSHASAMRFGQPVLGDRFATLSAIKRLSHKGVYALAEPNLIRQPFFTANDPDFAAQWHYKRINLPSAWQSANGDGVLVAVVDSGVVLDHPDINPRLDTHDRSGYDFIRNPRSAADGDGYDTNADDPGNGPRGGGSYHGTHVAGTIAAETNNGMGGAGAAFGAQIMPIRVLGRGGGTSFDLRQAVLYAAGLNTAVPAPARRADIINLSLGGAGFSQIMQNTFSAIEQAGVIVIAAAGNENTRAPSYPASYDGVISVSATTLQNQLAYYSNYGRAVDIAAPGGDIRSDRNGDRRPDGVLSTSAVFSRGTRTPSYAIHEGTSMAAPHVSGVVALMKSVHPTLTAVEFNQLLSSGALTDDLGTPGWDALFGYGLINAEKAVATSQRLATRYSTNSPKLSVEPSELNFAVGDDALELILENSGTGRLTVYSVNDNVGWLTVRPDSTITGGLGRYRVQLRRQNLAGGEHQGRIRIRTSTDTVDIPVVVHIEPENKASEQ